MLQRTLTLSHSSEAGDSFRKRYRNVQSTTDTHLLLLLWKQYSIRILILINQHLLNWPIRIQQHQLSGLYGDATRCWLTSFIVLCKFGASVRNIICIIIRSGANRHERWNQQRYIKTVGSTGLRNYDVSAIFKHVLFQRKGGLTSGGKRVPRVGAVTRSRYRSHNTTHKAT